jgi:DNA-binding NarL/FixJ family response regulator
MIKVAIVDDHKMFRDGVQAILNDFKTIQVVWSAANSKETYDQMKHIQPDVLLMDLTLGNESGITLTGALLEKHPELKVLAISMHYEDSYIVKILEMGARGYLLKDAGGEEMINAIKTVYKGDTYYSNYVSQVLINHITRGTKPKDKTTQIPLTKREIEILTLIAKEYSNPEIAKELFISIRTVDTHRRNLLDKLQAKNTAGLVKFAIKYGLIEVS